MVSGTIDSVVVDVPMRFQTTPRGHFDAATIILQRMQIVQGREDMDKEDAERILKVHRRERWFGGVSSEEVFARYGRRPDGLFNDPDRYDPRYV